MSVACPQCLGLRLRVLWETGNAARPNGLAGRILRCRSCGLLFKEFQASLDSLYLKADDSEAHVAAFMNSETAYEHFRNTLGLLPLPDKSGPSLLDVGTGTGTLLEVARSMGYRPTGVEYARPLAEKTRAKGFEIFQGRFEDLDVQGMHDAVTLMDVLEHTPAPLSMLRKAHGLLAPKGRILISTPDHASILVGIARLLRVVGMTDPAEAIFGSNHVVFFTQATLRAMLQRAGFTVERMVSRPYDADRAGLQASRTALKTAELMDRCGCLLTGAGFRMLAVARKEAGA